jgi:Secretion system C-terminal sorting domain/Fibronectin type III domain
MEFLQFTKVIHFIKFKALIMKKFISVSIASILIGYTVLAQSSGDYRSNGSGNWNDPTKWETYNGSTWVSTTTYPGQNSGTGAVTIKIFHELKLTATVPNAIASLLIEQLNVYTAEGIVVSQNGIVAFSSGNPVSLRVSGDVLIRGELKIDDLNGTKTHSLFVGAAFEVGTIFYYECGISEMIPATFQTINQDDKLGVVFTGSTWINTGGVGITFQDITFDGAGFSVTYPVHIKGNATFINGIVSIAHDQGYSNCTLGSSFNGDMIFYDGATVSGASNASFVDGWIYKIGDDPFTFPIGNQNVYAPLRISAPVSQSATVRAYYQRSNNGSETAPITDPGLFTVSNCENWTLSQDPGNNLDVTVSWNAASGCGSSPYITNVSEVTLAHSSEQEWSWSSHGGSGIGTTINGSVTRSGITNSYNTFTLGNLGACNTPSESSVTNITTNSATLNWSAANGAVSYDVDYKPYNSGAWINAATATTSTSVNPSGLSAYMSYDWRVRTNCSSSSSFYRQRGFRTLCGNPLTLSTTNITNSSATLNWSAFSDNAYYHIQIKQSTSTTWIPYITIQSLSYTLYGLAAGTSYDWKITASCNVNPYYDPENYQSSFTTLQGPPPPACTDPYETNNTSGQAKAISLGVVTPAIISSANDVDWFKVTTPNFSFTNLQVNLNNLPADYDLYVYNKSLKLIGSSINSGTSNEVVVYNSNARKATYYIKVIPKSGAFNSSQCYTLLAQTVSGGNITASHASAPVNEVTENTNKQFLYPNPASEFVYLNFNSATEGLVNIQIVNSIGQLVKQHPVNTIKGHNQFKIQVADIRPGMYILRINKGDLNMTRKFVIAR